MKWNVFALLLSVVLTSCAVAPPKTWSPTQSDLLFMSGRDGNSEIYVLPAGQREWINLSNHTEPDNWPVWSADGKRIAFQSKRSGNLDIWVMNADGSQQTQLTQDSEPDYLPAWSPDGNTIVFTSWRKERGDAERAPHIYAMNADGSNQRRLISQTLNTSAGATFSPDGKQIVYSRKGEKGADIYIADHLGQNERRVTFDQDKNWYNGAPVFSPDGKWLAFYADNEVHSSLVVIGVDGNNRRTILAEGKNWYPRWSPDGRWLTYTTPAPGTDSSDIDIYAITTDGQQAPQRLVGSPKREQEGSWRPQ